MLRGILLGSLPGEPVSSGLLGLEDRATPQGILCPKAKEESWESGCRGNPKLPRVMKLHTDVEGSADLSPLCDLRGIKVEATPAAGRALEA